MFWLLTSLISFILAPPFPMREPHWLAGMTSRRVTGGLELMVPLATNAVRSWREIRAKKRVCGESRQQRMRKEESQGKRSGSKGSQMVEMKGEKSHWRVLSPTIRTEQELNFNAAHVIGQFGDSHKSKHCLRHQFYGQCWKKQETLSEIKIYPLVPCHDEPGQHITAY